MSTKMKAWINLVLLAVTLAVNFLGGIGRINNMSQGEVSDMYNTLITPAGFTFSIWSIIYGLLIISMIVMLVKHDKDAYYKEAVDRLSPYIWLSFAANIIWIVLFSYLQIGLSTIFIFGYLFSLTLITRALKAMSHNREWLLPLTFGLNTGWLFIASVVNFAAFLVQIEWGGFGISEVNWAAIIMVVAVVLAIGVVLNLGNASFPLPIAWAFFGIHQALQAKGPYPMLEMISLVSIVVLSILAVFMFIRNGNAIYPQKDTA